jgi:hypothetical protein
MRASVVDFMAKKASENFKLKEVSFIGFDKIDIDETNTVENKDEDFSVDIEIWANLSIEYEGVPPDSYRVLNRMLQDWVDDNDQTLKKLINPNLSEFLKEKYENLDVSDLNQDFDDYIWEDQVDYMPDIDEEKKKIDFNVELVLEIEEDEDDNE